MPRGLTGLVALVLAACGGADAPAQDAQGHDLTIALFKHAPFVDGDTESAPMVAVQDGEGAWLAVTATDGVYHAHLASERHGVAIGCRTGASSFVHVLQRTVDDGLDLRTRGCVPTVYELDVDVRNVPADATAFVTTPGGSAGGGEFTYGFAVPPGPAEVFASLTTGGAITRLLRSPAFDVEDRAAIVIDFASAGAAPDIRSVAVTLDPGEQARVTSSVVRPSGEYALHAPAAIGTPATYAILPAQLRQPDDLYQVTVVVGSRSTTYMTAAPRAVTAELPPALAVQPPSVITAPWLHPMFSFVPTNPALALQSYALSVASVDDADAAHGWSAELSASWIAGAASLQYAFPDLSEVAGFAPELALSTRGPLRWSVQRTDASTAELADGRVTRTAVQSGAVGYCGDHAIEPPESCDPPETGSCSSLCNKLP
jgi:hypothetical protein